MTDAHSGHADLTSFGGDGAHSAKPLNNATLSAVLQSLQGADRVFFADLNELNNSEAEGGALLVLEGNKLTVITAATGVEAGQTHLQHIHGFEDNTNAVIPTLAQDDDRDGFIELAEGAETYGPVLLNLTSPPGPALTGFPKPAGSTFVFAQTYDLNDPVNGNLAGLLDNVSLTTRHIVLHGMSVLEGHGAGTTGEVKGDAGYKLVLPIAIGDIQELSAARALDRFQDSLSLDLGRTIRGTSNDDRLRGTDRGETLLGRSGDDVITGGRGDDYLNGGTGQDRLAGQQGNDYLEGGSGRDRLSGGSGDDYLIGGSGRDLLIGSSGHDHLDGGSNHDSLNGGGANDFLTGGSGGDAFVFDTRLNGTTNVDTILDFGHGNDSFRLDSDVFTGLSTESLSEEEFALISAEAEGDDRIVYDQSTGNLFFDRTGGSRDDLVQFATLQNKATITAGDFFVF